MKRTTKIMRKTTGGMDDDGLKTMNYQEAAIKKKTDDPDFFRKIGSLGGKTTQERYRGQIGFAADRELASRAGTIGGAKSRRTTWKKGGGDAPN